MNSFAPIFAEITDSSIWEEPYHVRLLWLTMLARKQADQVVYADAYRLRKWSNITEAETQDALRILSSPDERRKGQEHEGRRISEVPGGWLILNGAKYQMLMQVVAERARKARWAREYRAKATNTKPDGMGDRHEVGQKDVNARCENGHIAGNSEPAF